MTLTEQWKKGELEDGYYYMQLPNGDIRIITNGFITNCNGSSILSLVPSYEEYLALQSDSLAKNEGEEINAELENRMNLERQLYKSVLEENQQLKELLKECRDDIYNYQYICLGTLTKIDNAIGEKK